MDWGEEGKCHVIIVDSHVPRAVKEQGYVVGRALSQYTVAGEGFLEEVVFKLSSRDCFSISAINI